MKVIAIANQKGGVGKTTTSNCLISGLKERGYRVLGIDLDPQHNLSATMGAASTNSTILGVLLGEVNIKDAIVETPIGDLVASNMKLASADKALSDEIGKERRLEKALGSIADRYDYCIIDTPPALNLLTVNALMACDHVVIPVKLDGYSLQGYEQLTTTIRDIREYLDKSFTIAGILVTDYDSRTNISKEVLELLDQLTQTLDAEVFETRIRHAAKSSEIQFHKEGIFKYAPRTNFAKDYGSWIDELLESL